MILLDTNALLWLATDDARLGSVSRELVATDAPVYYSAVSIAEITIKHMLGKLPLPGGARFPDVFGEMGLYELPLSVRQASDMREVPELHGHDPFDRLLIAQAYRNRCTFLTADRRLLALERTWIRDVRA